MSQWKTWLLHASTPVVNILHYIYIYNCNAKPTALLQLLQQRCTKFGEFIQTEFQSVRATGYAIFQTTPSNFQDGGWLANYGYSPKVFCITRKRVHVTVERAQCIHNISARAMLLLPLQFFRMHQRIVIVGTFGSPSIEFAITYW